MVGADYFMQKATKRMTITRVTVAMYHADAVARCDAAELVSCDAEAAQRCQAESKRTGLTFCHLPVILAQNSCSQQLQPEERRSD